jgi:hypothetical protein
MDWVVGIPWLPRARWAGLLAAGTALFFTVALLIAGIATRSDAATEPGTVQPVAGSTLLGGVACPTTTECVAAGFVLAGSNHEGLVAAITSDIPGPAQTVTGTIPRRTPR